MSGRTETVVRSLGLLFTEGTHCGLTDTELLDRFLSRSDDAAAHAFEGLVLRHGPMVFDVCTKVLRNPHNAQDAFQATFLVLATRARSIRRKKSVGSWLHGVAFRVARRARSDAARRKAHERRIAEMNSRDVVFETMGDDRDFRVLHEEVERLPRTVPRAGRPLLPRGPDAGDGGRAARLSGQHARRPADAGTRAAEGPLEPARHLASGRPAHRGPAAGVGLAEFPGQVHGRRGGAGRGRRRGPTGSGAAHKRRVEEHGDGSADARSLRQSWWRRLASSRSEWPSVVSEPQAAGKPANPPAGQVPESWVGKKAVIKYSAPLMEGDRVVRR